MTMPRKRLLGVAVLAAAAFPVAGASPAAAASCKPAKYPGNGYFTSLTVRNISCSGGRDVMRAHYRCRIRRGGIKGRCPSFNGWRCSETRRAIRTEYNARVVCRKGSRTVKFTYQQNT